LLVALDDPHGRIAVVLTLRADFYDRPLLHPQFGRRLGDAVVNVTPMSTAELEEAAFRPAAEAGVQLEPRLLARLLADVVGEPGALPMFQYTLTELFERQHGGMLLESTYDKMSGLRGAITNRAEELYEELDPAEQTAAGQLFLRLVAMSDEETWSRRRVKASEILSLDVDVIALQSVINRFGAHRLLFFDRDKVTGSPTLEVGHEALLYEWPRLEEWIIRARRDLLRHAALRGAVDEWERSGRDPGYLLTGTRLAETEASSATASIHLNARELEYVQASSAARDAAEEVEEQRLASEARLAGSAKRRLWALVAVVAAVAAIALATVLATGGDPVRVALIHDNDDLIGRGLDEAARRYGIEPVSITPPWVSVESVGDELAKSGTELVIMSPFDAGTAEDLAARHPDTKFVVPFDPFDSVAPNYIRYTFAHEQGSYLAGIAAATVSESKVVGFMGAYDFFGDIHQSLAGFQQGVWSVDPSFEVAPAYVSPNPSDAAFDDVDAGHRTALELYEAGIDVVYHHAERSGLGVLSAARSATAVDGRHRWAIGSYSDQYFEANADDRDHMLMSVIRRLDTVVLDATQRLLADELTGPVYHLTMADGGLGYVDSGGKLPAGLADVLDEAMSSISDGSTVVTAQRAFGPTSNGQTDPTDSRFGLVGGGNSLTVAITPFSPFAEERDGVVLGFFPDLLEEVANRLALQVSYLEAPFPELLEGVEEGSLDVGACDCDITPERLERFLFASPVLKSTIGLAVLPGSPISSIDQVATVTVSPASSGDELIRTEYPDLAIEVASGPVHPGILERGQADAWVGDVDDFAPEVEVVQILQETLQAFTVNPELTELAAALQDTMNDMIADGTYGEIYDRWFDDDAYRVDR
ncbi:MAG: transporter substrate-binding domain-containing protein, partial [Acidimicrobiia bacterium]|nr:transporter substrate-binding domain-containing protein [Acidimicrobiia bacterium]